MTKICRDCNIEKELDEYYKHPGMLDGHLNKCKECVKKRVHGYWEDGRGKIVDAKRNQKPKRKAWQKEQSKRMYRKHIDKMRSRSKWNHWLSNNKDKRECCAVCGTNEKIEGHHPDYNKPLEVIWLCCKHHKQWHRENNYIPPNKV